MVYRHKISDTGQLKQVLIDSWAQRRQGTLNWVIDQKDWSWLSRQKMVRLNFVWTNHIHMLEIVLVLLYFEWKLSTTGASLNALGASLRIKWWWCHYQIRCNFGGIDDLEHLVTCKLCISFLTKFWNFWHIIIIIYLFSKMEKIQLNKTREYWTRRTRLIRALTRKPLHAYSLSNLIQWFTRLSIIILCKVIWS